MPGESIWSEADRSSHGPCERATRASREALEFTPRAPQAKTLVGTPHYFSPELVSGEEIRATRGRGLLRTGHFFGQSRR